MTNQKNIDEIMNQPERVQTLRRALRSIGSGMEPVIDFCRPYVDGLSHLPRDGRFLLVGNHNQMGVEGILIPHYVRREIGTRVRPLADRQFANTPGLAGDLMAAYGVVVGAPESAGEMMRHNETILVFPGGGREIPKFKGEEYTLRWEGRAGFARLSVEHDYPIVPAAVVGGDDLYQSVTVRDSRWGRLSERLTEKATGRKGMAMPLVRGIGPTLIPRPQRMYVAFGAPVDTTRPARVSAQKWVENVKQQTQESLEKILSDLLAIRATDPYRGLNPLAWRNAILPPPDETTT